MTLSIGPDKVPAVSNLTLFKIFVSNEIQMSNEYTFRPVKSFTLTGMVTVSPTASELLGIVTLTCADESTMFVRIIKIVIMKNFNALISIPYKKYSNYSNFIMVLLTVLLSNLTWYT